MKNIQNTKVIGAIAAFATLIGIVTLVIAFLNNGEDAESLSQKKYMIKVGGLILALAVVLFVLMWQTNRNKKKQKNRYHAVHWENGKVTREE